MPPPLTKAAQEQAELRAWFVWLGKFAFQVLAALSALAMFMGWAAIVRVPAVAQANGIEPFYLTLRCCDFDTDRIVWPLYLLDPGDRLPALAADLHLRPDALSDQVRDARALVASVYDLNDPQVRDAVHAWGDGLFRIGTYHASRADRRAKLDQRAASLDEACVVGALVLRGIQPQAARDLPRLRQLGDSAFPVAAERRAALAWAGGLYDRMAAAINQFQAADEADWRKANTSARVGLLPVTVVLPPRTPETLWWLLYQFVGLDAAARAEAARQWAELFPNPDKERVRGLGTQLGAARRAAGDALPPDSEAVPWVCLLERYQGLDPQGAGERALALAHFRPLERRVITGNVALAHPSDDFFYLMVSANRLHLRGEGMDPWIVILFILVMAYGARVWLFPVLAECCLRLHHQASYRTYRDGRGHGSFRVRLLGYLVVPLVAWGIALTWLPDHLVPLAGSPGSMLVVAYASVLLGGTFVGVLTRLTAVVMLRSGLDVNRVWYDEIVGLALGLSLLSYFGNDWLNLLVFAAAELLPMFLQPRPTEAV